MATEKARINFYATEKITSIIEKYTQELGINQGAFISMAISEYAKNDDMLRNMITLEKTISELQALADSAKKES